MSKKFCGSNVSDRKCDGTAEAENEFPIPASINELRESQVTDKNGDDALCSAEPPKPQSRVPNLRLPSLASNIILDYLGKNDLLNLRLTSKATNKWIESPEALIRLPLYLKNDKSVLAQVFESSVNWCNVSLETTSKGNWSTIYSLLQDNRIQRFELKTTMDSQALIPPLDLFKLILNFSSELKSFRFIGRVDTILIGHSYAVSEWLTPENRAIVKRNLERLKEFEMPMESDTALLGFIWENLKNVEKLVLPYGILNNHKVQGQPGTMEPEIFAADPLMTILAGIVPNQGGRKGVIIEFSTEWFQTSEYIFKHLYTNRRTGSMLHVISEICAKKDIRLCNVPAQYLPELSQVLTENQKLCLAKCVENVLLKNNPTGFRNLYLPPGCPVSIGFCMNQSTPDQHDRDYLEFPIPSDINVVCLHWDGDSNVFDELFEQIRPTVVELKLNAGSIIYHETLRGFIFSNVLPSLKKVHLVYCFEPHELRGLLSGLQELEDLTLERCYLSDDGFLEDTGDPYILNLPNLQHFRLLNCNYIHISAEAMRTLQLLTVKTFVCTVAHWKVHHRLTFENWLSHLNQIDGGLKDTLESIELPCPNDITKEKMDEFLRGFRNLRKSKIVYFIPRGKYVGKLNPDATIVCQEHNNSMLGPMDAPIQQNQLNLN